MSTPPVINTESLTLRPFSLEDAPRVRELAGAREVAAGLLSIPHPYPEGAAESWIASLAGSFERGEALALAMTLQASGELVGSVGLGINKEHRHAQLGYWVGVPYWNRGYATEAVRAMIDHGFTVLGLRRIFAQHFADNPASGRVLQKAGMTYEGTLRQHVEKWGEARDLSVYAILCDEFQRGVRL